MTNDMFQKLVLRSLIIIISSMLYPSGNTVDEIETLKKDLKTEHKRLEFNSEFEKAILVPKDLK